jgi:hypothetical protein
MHKLKLHTKSVATALLLSLICIAAHAQIPIKTDGSWKVLRARPGSSLPVGWELLNYNDAPWPFATLVSIPNCLTPHNQTPVTVNGTTGLPIWANNGATCSTPNDVILFRKKFNVTKIEGCPYTLTIKVDNTSKIWINGTFIDETNNNWATGDVFTITDNIVNGQNIIAIRATDDVAGITAWLSAVIIVGKNCGTY